MDSLAYDYGYSLQTLQDKPTQRKIPLKNAVSTIQGISTWIDTNKTYIDTHRLLSMYGEVPSIQAIRPTLATLMAGILQPSMAYIYRAGYQGGLKRLMNGLSVRDRVGSMPCRRFALATIQAVGTFISRCKGVMMDVSAIFNFLRNLTTFQLPGAGITPQFR